MKNRYSLLLLAALLSITLSGCRLQLDRDVIQDKDTESISSMKSIPSFNLEDLKGNKITNKCFQNADLTILNVWSTTCGPCVEELSALEKIKNNNLDQSIQVITILADGKEGEPDAINIAAEQNLTYTTLIPDDDFMKNFVSKEQSVPYTVFVDSDGNILHFFMGAMSFDEFQKQIDKQMRRFY